MSKNGITIQHVLVTAVVHNKRATLVDAQGRVICRNVELARLGKAADEASLQERWEWRHAAARMKACVTGRITRRTAHGNPWQRKADCLAKSFQRRSTDHVRPRGRCRFEQYNTTTWDEAAKRMLQQGYNRFRYLSRSGWHRWAYTVSNNHNKKMGGRYAEARYGNGQTDSETDREATVSLRPERPKTDT